MDHPFGTRPIDFALRLLKQVLRGIDVTRGHRLAYFTNLGPHRRLGSTIKSAAVKGLAEAFLSASGIRHQLVSVVTRKDGFYGVSNNRQSSFMANSTEFVQTPAGIHVLRLQID